MIELSAIEIHLTLKDHVSPTGKKIQSCLTAALNEARFLTGRNTATGIPNSEDESALGRWTGAMCYTTILDQIGSCYRPKLKQEQSEKVPCIKKALHYFTNLNDKDISAIYALRCAFFHDFALININAKHPELQHLFSVYNHPTNPLIIHAQEMWDGDIFKDRTGKFTAINLKALGDLVESVYKELLILHSKNELAVALSGGEVQLLNCYTFSH